MIPMQAVSGRHVFWSAPRPPFMTNGPIRTVPIRNAGSRLGLAGGFLGQNVGSTNRLYNVSIPAILGRIQLAPQIQTYLASLQQQKQNPQPGGFGRFGGGGGGGGRMAYQEPATPPNFPPMTDQEKQTLFEVAQNPTDEELKDLALIDSVFTQHYAGSYTTTAEVCNYLSFAKQYGAQIFGEAQGGGGAVGRGWFMPRYGGSSDAALQPMGAYFFAPPLQAQGGRAWFSAQEQQVKLPDSSFMKDKFYCTLDNSSKSYQVPWDTRDWVSWFGLDMVQPWGGLKLPVQNGQTIFSVVASFPFPPPIDKDRSYFWAPVMQYLPKLANIGQPIDPEALAAWVTMATIQNYDSIVNRMIADAKAEAKKKKRQAIIKAIGLSIAGIVAAFILPPIIAAIASMIKLAIETYIDLKQRREAAKQMADAAKMFEKDAPAFAAQVQKTADMMDASTAEAQANTPLTPEQSAAVQEVAAETPSAPIGHYVIGGVAAGGIVAALVALLR
jgi:hypothetical protein